MLKIAIFNETKSLINPVSIRRLIKRLFRLLFDNSDSYLEIDLVSLRKIARLNKQYLNHCGPTDIISFPNANPDRAGRASIGSLVICPVYLKKYDQDLAAVVQHGLLHLAGFDHDNNLSDWINTDRKATNELQKI